MTPLDQQKALFDLAQLQPGKIKVTEGGDVITLHNRQFEIVRRHFAVAVRVTTKGERGTMSTQTVPIDNEFATIVPRFFQRAAEIAEAPAPNMEKPAAKKKKAAK